MAGKLQIFADKKWRTTDKATITLGGFLSVLLSVFAAKRLYIIAQGFNPGFLWRKKRPESGARTRRVAGLGVSIEYLRQDSDEMA
jgi:hypothetical protein